MELPLTNDLKETELFWMWLGQNGILYAKYKKNVVVTLDALQQTYALLYEMIGNKKVCQLVDMTNRVQTSAEARNYAAVENTKFIEAQALLVSSPLNKYIATLYITMKPSSYPVKIFTDEEAALEWLYTHQ